jgi:hypothetical protein
MRPHGACAPNRGRRPDHEVADIFRAHGEHYRATRPPTADQRMVMWCIEACRTAVLGGHVDVCEDCGEQGVPAYNSCRNRHCPKCQALDQARWLEGRRERILPVGCFHLVFTLPSELRPLARRNPKPIFATLVAAASQTLLELGKTPKRLGALPGITAVLHTWTRDLLFHPHLHCVVTAGGLALDEDRWVDSRRRFLFPVAVMSKLFRGKFIAALERLHRRDQLDLGDANEPAPDLAQLRNKLLSNRWVVYAKRPFAGPEQVFSYLGLYTHRVAISNHRLVSVTDHAVTIATRNGKTATMHPLEFIRRFLMHVLPTGFVKIRHYGLWASGNVKTKLQTARQLLEADGHMLQGDGDVDEPVPDWRQLLESLTGIDVATCSVCGSARLRRRRLPRQRRADQERARSPPARGDR